MPATTTGAPFSLNVPSLSSDLADLFGTYLVPNMTAINTNAAHKGTAQTFSALQTFSAGATVSSGNVTVSSGTIILPAGSASAPSIAPSGDANTGTFYPAADTIAWATGGSERVRVNSSGNVGIGTGSPASMLDIVGQNSAQFSGYQVFTTWRDTNDANKGFRIQTAGGNTLFSTDATGGGTYTERMRITSSGNVGIGTSSPGEKLHITNGNFAIDKSAYGGYLKWTQGTTSPRAGYWEWGDGTGWRMDFGPSANPRLSIYDNGNVGIGTSSPGYQLTLSTDSAAKPTSNTWTISSDARVKTVLGDFTRGLMDIVGLMPKRYHLNGAYGTVDDGQEHVSIIAQDVQTTWPAMVGEYTHVEKDEETGTETETTLLSLNTNELQWALVNAIKELTARVVALEAQVASA